VSTVGELGRCPDCRRRSKSRWCAIAAALDGCPSSLRTRDMPFLLVLVLLEATVALALVVSLLVALGRRKIFRRLWLVLGGAFLLLAGAIVEAGHTMPFFDDGPFAGEACAAEPQGAADQVFPVADGKLESFDAVERGETAVVRFVEGNGRTLWCVRASGYPSTSVSAVRFHRSRNQLFRIVVAGTVAWTYGQERTLWYLSSGGMLREYWYSW
jgi:hypothetical protein